MRIRTWWDRASSERQGWRALLLVLVSLAASASGCRGVFLFDDYIMIVDNRLLRELATCMLHSTRPLVNLTLWANYHLGGLNPFGYHLFNILLHVIATLVLWGVLRGALRSRFLPDGCRLQAEAIALWTTLLWTVHPLHTETVTYIIQRAEGLASLFMLLAVYTFFKAGEGAGPTPRWLGLSVIACALAMASKPIAVVLPVVLLLLDSGLVSGGLRAALRERRGYYALLGLTWVILIGLVLSPNESTTSAGPGAEILAPFGYFRTQPEVVLHYARLILWPDVLCLDYAWPTAVSQARFLLPLGLWLSLMLLIGLRSRGGSRLWLLPALFFALLAPTSSFIPVADVAVEHRTYLASVLVLLAVVLGVFRGLNGAGRPGGRRMAWAAGALGALAIGSLVARTAIRNRDYASEHRMWWSLAVARPHNTRAWLGVASSSLREGHDAAAAAALGRVFGELPDLATARRQGQDTVYVLALNNLGVLYRRQNRLEDAETCFVQVLDADPGNEHARGNLAIVRALMARRQQP